MKEIMKKKMINQWDNVSLDICYVGLDNLKRDIETLILQYGKDAVFNCSWDDDGVTQRVAFERLETDREYNHRITLKETVAKQKKFRKKTKEENDVKEYERLKKKFEKIVS